MPVKYNPNMEMNRINFDQELMQSFIDGNTSISVSFSSNGEVLFNSVYINPDQPNINGRIYPKNGIPAKKWHFIINGEVI